MFPSPAQLNARNKSRNGEGLGPRLGKAWNRGYEIREIRPARENCSLATCMCAIRRAIELRACHSCRKPLISSYDPIAKLSGQSTRQATPSELKLDPEEACKATKRFMMVSIFMSTCPLSSLLLFFFGCMKFVSLCA